MWDLSALQFATAVLKLMTQFFEDLWKQEHSTWRRMALSSCKRTAKRVVKEVEQIAAEKWKFHVVVFEQ